MRSTPDRLSHRPLRSRVELVLWVRWSVDRPLRRGKSCRVDSAGRRWGEYSPVDGVEVREGAELVTDAVSCPAAS